MTKKCWLVSLIFFLLSAGKVSAGSDNCARDFLLNDQQTMIKSLQVIPGQKVILKSTPPNQDIVVNCGSFPNSSRDQGSWAMKKEFNFSDLLPESMQGNQKGMTPVEIRNSSEFPSRTLITVSNKGSSIFIKDTVTGTSVVVSCLPDGFLQIETLNAAKVGHVLYGGSKEQFCKDGANSFQIDVGANSITPIETKSQSVERVLTGPKTTR